MGFYKLITAKLFVGFHWRSAQTLETIGLPSVGGEFLALSLMDFTEFELQRIPYSFHASYLA